MGNAIKDIDTISRLTCRGHKWQQQPKLVRLQNIDSCEEGGGAKGGRRPNQNGTGYATTFKTAADVRLGSADSKSHFQTKNKSTVNIFEGQTLFTFPDFANGKAVVFPLVWLTHTAKSVLNVD